MVKGNKNRGRGGHRGSSRGQSFPGRGRGDGRGRGRGGGRGRGRGSPPGDDYDFAVQMWPDDLTYNGTPRGRGRGRGSYPGSGRDSPAIRVTDSPRGRGSSRGRGRGDANNVYGSPRGRGRPGQLNSNLRAGAPLSKLLYEDRPLLKPITFVRSVFTATLFQQEEDILQPIVEPVADDEKSHVPTADRVTRVFDGETEGEGLSGDEEKMEEIDFADVGKMQAEVDAITATMANTQSFASQTKETQGESVGFYVDTTPAPVIIRSTSLVETDRMEGTLGDDEEIIVYVAPHPRISLSRTTIPAPVTEAFETITTTSILTGRELTESHTADTIARTSLPSVLETEVPSEEPSAQENTQHPTLVAEQHVAVPLSTDEPPSLDSVSFSFETSRTKQSRRLFPVGGPRSLLQRSKKPRRRTPRHFGAFGAAVSEAQLQREGRLRDPREAEQRRGDSDVNFGESSDDEIEEVSTGMGAMNLDADAEISLEAMQSFVKSMSAEGSRHVTMDDIADGARMRAEDAEQRRQGGSRESDAGNSEEDDVQDASEEEEKDEETEAALDAAERELVGEDVGSEDEVEEDEDDAEEEEDVSSDDDQSPKAGFQARLARMRAGATGQNKGKGKGRQLEDSSDEDMEINVAWADEDEDFIAEIQEMLDANAHILSNGDRKGRKKLFRAIENGDFDDDEFAVMMKPAERKNNKHIPPQLQEQWERDRQKKAENKRKRREAKLANAADPLAVHKGGKKGRKAMLAAARLDSHIEVENRVVDLVSLEAQIRRFLFDIDGKDTMALPPCDKATRKMIHELANAFNLKSESKGKGAGRYTTLIKTSMSGIGINEKKVKYILKGNKDTTWDAPDGGKGKGKGKIQSLAKHREGEEVGKTAPKIGQSNIGFRMLASMGWAEGDKIGLSGGLDAPLVAKMKKTKLGLGATMQ